MTLLTDAKARITIYGIKNVINQISDFWREGAILDTPKRKKLFINICQAMRKDSLPKNQKVLDNEMSQLLFGTDL